MRYFGDNAFDELEPHECYLFSKTSPDDKCDPNDPVYEQALNEVASYIKNIREEYGGFVYAEKKTPITPEMSILEYSMRMTGKKYNGDDQGDDDIDSPKYSPFLPQEGENSDTNMSTVTQVSNLIKTQKNQSFALF